MRTQTVDQIVADYMHKIELYDKVQRMTAERKSVETISRILGEKYHDVYKMTYKSTLNKFLKKMDHYKKVAEESLDLIAKGYMISKIESTIGLRRNTIYIALGIYGHNVKREEINNEPRVRNPKKKLASVSKFVRCKCGRSEKRVTDLHCIICDGEYNRQLAGLPPKTTMEHSLKQSFMHMGLV